MALALPREATPVYLVGIRVRLDAVGICVFCSSHRVSFTWWSVSPIRLSYKNKSALPGWPWTSPVYMMRLGRARYHARFSSMLVRWQAVSSELFYFLWCFVVKRFEQPRWHLRCSLMLFKCILSSTVTPLIVRACSSSACHLLFSVSIARPGRLGWKRWSSRIGSFLGLKPPV